MKKIKYEVIQGWYNKNNDGESNILKSFETFEEAWKFFNEVKGNKHQEKITDNTPFYKLTTEIVRSTYIIENDNELLNAWNFYESETITSFTLDFRSSALRK